MSLSWGRESYASCKAETGKPRFPATSDRHIEAGAPFPDKFVISAGRARVSRDLVLFPISFSLSDFLP